MQASVRSGLLLAARSREPKLARFSYRDVEDLLAERGVDVSYETIRRWSLKFGQAYARKLRQSRPRPDDRWHLDEVFSSINGKRMYLWRAVDSEGAWKGGLAPTMRQSHVAGEKMFVDYAGATLEVIDGLTGEVRAAQIFVATLGASSYTYAEATWTQALPNWIGSHSRAFAYFGGVAAQVVPDNLKSGVVKACLYDPEINRTYAGMAAVNAGVKVHHWPA